jgi:hypothetical protein
MDQFLVANDRSGLLWAVSRVGVCPQAERPAVTTARLMKTAEEPVNTADDPGEPDRRAV